VIAAPNLIARADGYHDGYHARHDHAARWPQGLYGAADYALGVAEGVGDRALRTVLDAARHIDAMRIAGAPAPTKKPPQHRRPPKPEGARAKRAALRMQAP
jgi:hypothetical protein